VVIPGKKFVFRFAPPSPAVFSLLRWDHLTSPTQKEKNVYTSGFSGIIEHGDQIWGLRKAPFFPQNPLNIKAFMVFLVSVEVGEKQSLTDRLGHKMPGILAS
jgi:hypothetical protein